MLEPIADLPPGVVGFEAVGEVHADDYRTTLIPALDAQDGPLRLNIADPGQRSAAVTALRLGAPHGTALRGWVERHLGLTLGVGLGMAPPGDPAWHGFFRLGHMGHVNGQMVLGMLGGIEAGLTALGIPHGRGAVEAAAAVIAGVEERAPPG